MRKKVLFLAALLAFATSQLYSQENNGMLYRSDFRLGITAGTNINLQRNVFMWPDKNCKLTEILDSYKDIPAINVGLYLGHEHDIGSTGKMRLGIDGSICYSIDNWKVDFKNDTNDKITNIKYSVASIAIDEGIYLSYLLTDKLSVHGGINFYEQLLLPTIPLITSDEKEPPLVPQTTKQKKHPEGIGIKAGARLRVGAAYNFNTLLFVSGNLFYSVPFYNTTTAKKLTIEHNLAGEGNMGLIGKYRDFIQNVGVMFTFGFKL